MTNKEAIHAIESNMPTSGYTILKEALGMAIKALKLQEDICYCKDCEIRDKDGYCMMQMTFNLTTMVEDTDFCSWGERGER